VHPRAVAHDDTPRSLRGEGLIAHHSNAADLSRQRSLPHGTAVHATPQAAGEGKVGSPRAAQPWACVNRKHRACGSMIT
jgi:hypothetical protein